MSGAGGRQKKMKKNNLNTTIASRIKARGTQTGALEEEILIRKKKRAPG